MARKYFERIAAAADVVYRLSMQRRVEQQSRDGDARGFRAAGTTPQAEDDATPAPRAAMLPTSSHVLVLQRRRKAAT